MNLKQPYNNGGAGKPIIYIIGGTYGVGKTTLAQKLSVNQNIYQRTGLGAIAKTLSACYPENEAISDWDQYASLSRTSMVNKFVEESKIVGKIISTIVDNAVTHGQSYIIDGVQLLPEYLPLDRIKFFVLKVKNDKDHAQRLLHPNGTKLKQTEGINFKTAKLIEKMILQQAKKYNVPVFENDKSPDETYKKIAEHYGTAKKLELKAA